MCVGSLDACAEMIATPLFIALAPIIFIYRALRYLYSFVKKPQIKPEPEPEPQPIVLHITIPPCEDPIESL